MKRTQATACLALMLLCATTEAIADAWEYEIEGSLLYSKPVVSDARVYICYRGKKPLRQHYVVCLSATSGNEIWNRMHNDDLMAPPVLERGRLFLPAGLDGVICLDGNNGKELWAFKEAKYPSSSSLSASDGRLLVTDRKHWFCLNGASGHEIWRVRTGDIRVRPEWESGKVFLVVEQSVSTWKAVAIEAATGRFLWQSDLTEGRGRKPGGMILDEGHLYVVQHDRTSRINTSNGKTSWVANRGTWLRPTVAAHSIVLVGRELTALDVRTGETKWTLAAPEMQRPRCGSGWVYTRPHVAAGKLVVGHPSNDLLCVDPRTGEVEWQKNLLNLCPKLVCDGEQVVVVADGQLLGIDIETGRQGWGTKLPAGYHHHIAARDGQYFISVDGYGLLSIQQNSHERDCPTSCSTVPSKAAQSAPSLGR